MATQAAPVSEGGDQRPEAVNLIMPQSVTTARLALKNCDYSADLGSGEMVRLIANLTQQVADLKSSIAGHATNAAFHEVKKQVALKAFASDLTQTNVQIAKCAQNADLARELSTQAFKTSAMNKDGKLELERRLTSLEKRFESTNGSTTALVKQLQKDALAFVEQRCLLATAKVQTELTNLLASNLELKADKASVESWLPQIKDLHSQLQADRNEVDRLRVVLLNDVSEGMRTVQQKVENGAHEIDRTVVDRSMADSIDRLVNSRIEELSNIFSGFLAQCKAECKQVEELSSICAGKANQTALDSLVQACKAECKRVDELSALCASKASQSDVDRCMALCNSKADREVVDDLSQRCISKALLSEIGKYVSCCEMKTEFTSQASKDIGAMPVQTEFDTPTTHISGDSTAIRIGGGYRYAQIGPKMRPVSARTMSASRRHHEALLCTAHSRDP